MYTDIPQSHWASPYILKLTEEGIIVGSGQKFRPDDPITRAEYSVMLKKSFDRIQVREPKEGFADLPKDHWAFDAMQVAYTTGFFRS